MNEDLGKCREEGGMLLLGFNVEIITWLHASLMVESNPKTAQVFDTWQKPSRCSGGVCGMFPDLSTVCFSNGVKSC